jgi:hypothetical protein
MKTESANDAFIEAPPSKEEWHNEIDELVFLDAKIKPANTSEALDAARPQ